MCDDVDTMAEPQTEPAPDQPRLRRLLRTRDLVLTQILCVVGSSWVGVAAGTGRAQTVFWIAAMLVFYLPMAASVIALNRAMPLEGGLYAWAHRAFGDLGGFMTAWNLWVYGVAVTATILYAIPTEIAYLIGPRAAALPENRGLSFLIVALLVMLIASAAVRGLELGKWVHNLGGAAIMLNFAMLILLPVWALVTHRPADWRPFAMAMPVLNLRSLALFAQMIFGALCGLEYIAILAGESRRPEVSIGRSVWIASPIICLMFILGTGAVLAFSRPGHIDFIAPIPQTLRLALGTSGAASAFAIGAILLLQVRLLGAASYLFTGVTRLPLAVGWDHLLPAWFARLHPHRRTPVNATLFTAALVLLLLALGSAGVHAQEAYQLLSGAALTHYELAYLAMFLIPVVGAASVRGALPRGLRWIAGVGFCATLFSLLLSAYPIVDVVDRRSFAVKIVGTVAVSNLIGWGFFRLRLRQRAAKAVVARGAPETIESQGSSAAS